jgi:hypothetical protein
MMTQPRHLIFLPTLMALALPLPVGAQQKARFPKATGTNLEKKRFTLPGDLQGDLNIVILGFQREQQAAIDAWIPTTKELCATTPALRYYELPVLQKTTPQEEAFVDAAMTRGIPDREARDRTITLYLDKKPFAQSLGIADENAIHILLMDRQGGIVWSGEGQHTSLKAAALATAARGWLKTKGPRIETLSGTTASLEDYRGKVVFLILSGKGPAGAASLLLQEVIVGSSAQKDIAYVTDADLTAAPGMLRGFVRDNVKDTAKKNHDRLVAALEKAGIPANPKKEPVVLLDWQGVLPRYFDVSGKTDRSYHVCILNRDGKTVFRYAQPWGSEKTPSPTLQMIRMLKETVSPGIATTPSPAESGR